MLYPAEPSLWQFDKIDAALAQLDRASGFEPEGREFESLRPRFFFQQKVDFNLILRPGGVSR